MKIIIGNTNGQIGHEEEFISTIGKHSKRMESNENGKLLMDFATGEDMKIKSIFFRTIYLQGHVESTRRKIYKPNRSCKSREKSGKIHHKYQNLRKTECNRY